jgi:putative peptidoglycan lipid II flippase
VARVQALFALQIPFYVLGIIGVRLLSATGGNRLLMWISIGNFVTNIVGNYVFMQFWGVAGIALSTSLVYVVSSVVIYAGVRRRIAVHTEARTS